jgi:hypothetical protein
MVKDVHVKFNFTIAVANAAFNKKKNFFASKTNLSLRKKLVICYSWSIALHGAET